MADSKNSKRWSALVLGLATGLANAAAPTWLVVLGNPAEAEVDTVQVDPASIVVLDEMRQMQVRVSRARPRMGGYDGLPYRSYGAAVLVDCGDRSARFRRMTFYQGPLWTGAQRTAEFSRDQMPPMAFAEMQPNPAQRIVNAACTIDRIGGGS